MIKRVTRDEAEQVPLPGRVWHSYFGPKDGVVDLVSLGVSVYPRRLASPPGTSIPAEEETIYCTAGRGRIVTPDGVGRGRAGRRRPRAARHLPRHRGRRARRRSSSCACSRRRSSPARTRRRTRRERRIRRSDAPPPTPPRSRASRRSPAGSASRSCAAVDHARAGPPRRSALGRRHAGRPLLPRHADPSRRARLGGPGPVHPVQGPLVDRAVRGDGAARLPSRSRSC